MTAIHVAVATDRDYAMPLAAMLASLTDCVNPARALVFHVLTDRLPDELWSRIVRSVPNGRVEWNRIGVNSGDLVEQGFSTRAHGHISPVTYCRLLLPELLPRTVEKVLYLDCDLIVCDDIAPLWDTEIDTVDLAAAPQFDLAGRRVLAGRSVRDYRELGMAPGLAVFNVGVLLMNLRRWRQSGLAERTFDCLRSMGSDNRWYEQEAINIVVNGSYRELDPRWNTTPVRRRSGNPSPLAVSIIHFFTAKKPWHWDYGWAYRGQFFENLDRTPWAGWRPERPRFGRTRRLRQRVARARQKGHDAVVGLAERLGGRRQSRMVMSPRHVVSSGGALPRKPGGEIRLFLALEPGTSSSELALLLEAYWDAGVDRAFVLDCSNGLVAPERSVVGRPIHVFRCHPDRAKRGLRHLLDRYGTVCWCVLGSSPRVLGNDAAHPVRLREWCEWLDRIGIDLVELRTGSDAAQPIEFIGRDLRTGRLFRSTVLIESRQRAWDPPTFGSRVALVKYRKSILLDDSLVLAGNVSRDDWFLRPAPASSGRLSVDPQDGSLAPRS